MKPTDYQAAKNARFARAYGYQGPPLPSEPVNDPTPEEIAEGAAAARKLFFYKYGYNPPGSEPTGVLASINWRTFIGVGLIVFAALTFINHYLGGGGFFGPTASSAYIVTIDDFKLRTNDNGLELARFLSDGDYWSKIEAAGHSYRQLDTNHPTATQPYAAQILKNGLPLMILMSNDPPTKGTILWEGKIPTGPPEATQKFLDDLLAQRIKK
jgi:hypothetical protein